MAAWTVVARQAANLARVSTNRSAATSTQATAMVQRRGFASGGDHDHHGPVKVNIWEDFKHPGNWKEEQFVIVSIAGWGLVFYGAYKFFTGGKKDKKEEKVAEGAH